MQVLYSVYQKCYRYFFFSENAVTFINLPIFTNSIWRDDSGNPWTCTRNIRWIQMRMPKKKAVYSVILPCRKSPEIMNVAFQNRSLLLRRHFADGTHRHMCSLHGVIIHLRLTCFKGLSSNCTWIFIRMTILRGTRLFLHRKGLKKKASKTVFVLLHRLSLAGCHKQSC